MTHIVIRPLEMQNGQASVWLSENQKIIGILESDGVWNMAPGAGGYWPPPIRRLWIALEVSDAKQG